MPIWVSRCSIKRAERRRTKRTAGEMYTESTCQNSNTTTKPNAAVTHAESDHCSRVTIPPDHRAHRTLCILHPTAAATLDTARVSFMSGLHTTGE